MQIETAFQGFDDNPVQCNVVKYNGKPHSSIIIEYL